MQLIISRRIRNQLLSSLIGLFSVIPGLLAAPQGGVIAGGSGNINTHTANTTTINQNSQSMVVNWSSFNVNANESVNFVQPSSSAAVLNQIHDQNPSQILGSINANGRVFLSNPNGMIFGVNSVVNVGALVATNLNISASDFMSGDYSFGASTNSAGAIINQGIIQAATGGSVALIGGSVKNEGVILAHYGHVALATGRQATINFDGDGLLNFQIDESVLENTVGTESAIHNTGSIIADAGQILLSAHASEGIFTNVINNEGLIQATRIENIGGVIHLSGNTGRVISSGDISATGQNGVGGEVHVLGDQVGLFDHATINASGSDGGGVVLIGGDYQGNNPEIKNAQQTYVGADALIKADAIDSGDGGKVIVWADKTTQYYGDISAQGGEVLGDGGFVEVSGKQWLDFQGEVDTRAINGFNGTLLLDPTNITIQTAGTDTVESDSGSPETFSDTADPTNESILTVGVLVAALGNGDVKVSTESDNSAPGVADGDITVANDITWASSQSLTLSAENNIIVNAGLSGVNGSIILTADSGGNGAGSLASSAVITAGSITLEGNQLAINQNITSTSGDITFTGIGLTTFGQEVKVTSSGNLVSSALTGEGKLTLKSIGDMTLAASTVKNGDFLLDAGAGLLDLGGVMTAKDVSILAGDVDITDTTIVASGTVSISDQPVGGGGIGLVATQLKKLNLSNTELLAITSTELTLKSVNGVVLEGDLNLAEMTTSLKIDANTFDSISVTNILLGGGLDFVDTKVKITGQTTIDIEGAYAMNGAMLIEGTGGVKIDAASGITMGAPSSITTTNDAITLIGATNDVKLGLLNAGTAAVSVTATAGDILNNNGVFSDVDSALTNIKGGSVTLVALNQIGVSNTDAITLDINENSTINLTFGAPNAYINNLQNAKVINNSAGNIVVGNIFSSQVIGVGFNLGSNVDVNHGRQLNEQGYANLTSDDLLVSVLGADFKALFGTDDDEIVSTIIPSVPVLVEGLNGWEFVAPSKRQVQDQKNKNQNQKKGVLYLDWL